MAKALVLLYVASWFFWPTVEISADDSASVNVAKPNASEKELIAKLQDRQRWKAVESRDVKNKLRIDHQAEKEMLLLLERAGRSRSPRVAAVLLDRIGYMPPSMFAKFRPRPLRNVYPVQTALIAIGLPAVQPILNRVKSYDTAGLRFERFKEADKSERKRLLLTIRSGDPDPYCQFHWDRAIRVMIDIYNRAGHGKEMAKRRLELEIKNSRNRERERLQWILQNSFKEPEPEAAGVAGAAASAKPPSRAMDQHAGR